LCLWYTPAQNDGHGAANDIRKCNDAEAENTVCNASAPSYLPPAAFASAIAQPHTANNRASSRDAGQAGREEGVSLLAATAMMCILITFFGKLQAVS
jgi:hypothetical protein